MALELENIPTWVPVVSARLCDSEGRWLMHRRPADKAHGGLWEFPGGKVEHGENPRQAVVRELREELGVTVAPSDCYPTGFADSADDRSSADIVLFLYTIHRWSGEPAALEGGAVGWYTPNQAYTLATPPLDRQLLVALLKV